MRNRVIASSLILAFGLGLEGCEGVFMFGNSCQFTWSCRDLNAESAQEATRLHGLANSGDVHAQSSLGVLYEFGDGVDQDNVQADMWYSLAAAHGIDTAAKNRDDIEKKMTPAQIAQAKKLASEWKPTGG